MPGQYFCTYTGEDVQKLVIPVAEISLSEVSSLYKLVAQGEEEIFVTLSSEGIIIFNLILFKNLQINGPLINVVYCYVDAVLLIYFLKLDY